MGGHTFVGDELETEAAQSFIDLIYQTADGFMSVAIMRHTEWVGLANAVGRPEWLEDPRFQDTAGLEEHKNARLELTQQALLEKTTAEWIEIFEAVDVPCAPVLTRRDMINHAQIRANGILQILEHPHAGALRQANNAAQFAGTPAMHRRGAPAHGEHSAEILSELGYDDESIEELIHSGIVARTEASS